MTDFMDACGRPYRDAKGRVWQCWKPRDHEGECGKAAPKLDPYDPAAERERLAALIARMGRLRDDGTLHTDPYETAAAILAAGYRRGIDG